MPLRTTARITALRPGQSPTPVSTPIRMTGHPSPSHLSAEVLLQTFDGAGQRACHRLLQTVGLYIGAVDEQRTVAVLEHVDGAQMKLHGQGTTDDAVLQTT